MNIMICDGVEHESDKLTQLLESCGFEIKMTVFNNGIEALAFARKNKAIDICFLDIQMLGMNGIELAGALRESGYTGEIVFHTATNEFAHQSYRVRAFDYLLKPTTADVIRDVLCRIERVRKYGDTNGIMVCSKGNTSYVLLRDIEYAEVILHKVYFRQIDNSRIELKTTFAEIAPRLLNDRRFARCHRSYIVNMNAISAIKGYEITMRSGTIIPISRSYSDVKRTYMDWGLEVKPNGKF